MTMHLTYLTKVNICKYHTFISYLSRGQLPFAQLSIKSLVIQQWLEGKPRNYIAADNGLSDGAVTNIVNEWKHNLGFSLADDLRELAVTMRRVGVTASQCALGFRVAMIMLNMGIKEDDFESYILDIYNRLRTLDYHRRTLLPIS